MDASRTRHRCLWQHMAATEGKLESGGAPRGSLQPGRRGHLLQLSPTAIECCRKAAGLVHRTTGEKVVERAHIWEQLRDWTKDELEIRKVKDGTLSNWLFDATKNRSNWNPRIYTARSASPSDACNWELLEALSSCLSYALHCIHLPCPASEQGRQIKWRAEHHVLSTCFPNVSGIFYSGSVVWRSRRYEADGLGLVMPSPAKKTSERWRSLAQWRSVSVSCSQNQELARQLCMFTGVFGVLL